jgi:isopenicillin N synthase-like dioxygenase
LKEGIYLGSELDESHPKVQQKIPLHGANQFPAQVPALKENILEWLKEMDRVGELLLEAIAESLGLPRPYFKEHFCKDHF